MLPAVPSIKCGQHPPLYGFGKVLISPEGGTNALEDVLARHYSFLEISTIICYRLYSMGTGPGAQIHIELGGWTEIEIDRILHESCSIEDVGGRIAFLSGLFLGLPYRESTLLGNADTDEVFVINLSGVDCFTFLDYIEAMRLSTSFATFRKNLQQVRYRDGIVSYENRRHFFTDWADFSPASVEDLTGQIGGEKTINVLKTINMNADNALLLPGVAMRQRLINYIPSEHIDISDIRKLKTGDYAGIYSLMPGLDVSHVGIIINTEHTVMLRHASSDRSFRKVIDQDLQDYLSGKPGMLILRPTG